jgi:hypothetical protein
MSEIPRDLGSALYGPSGPATGPVGPSAGVIDGGKAGTPAPSFRGQPISTLPAAADERSVMPNQPASPAPSPPAAPQQAAPSTAAEPRSMGQIMYGAPQQPETAGDAPQYTLPPDMEPIPELLQSFGETARDLRVDRQGAERLLQLHATAVQESVSRQGQQWAQETRSYYNDPDTLAETVSDVRERISSLGDSGKAFLDLMKTTQLGNNIHVIRTLEALVRGSRGY